MVTADEDTWLGLTGNFAEALATGNLKRTYQIGHPGVTAMWVSLAGLGFDRARSYAGLVIYGDRASLKRAAASQPNFIADLNAARRAHAVVNALLIAALGLLACRLLGTGIGLLSGGLMALDPLLAAHAQVIRMDSLQAGFLGAGVLSALVRWTSSGGRAYLVVAGGALGLALLSKSSTLVVALPLVLSAAFACVRSARQDRSGLALRRMGCDLLVLTVSAFTSALAGLPALWAAPAATLRRLVDFTVWSSGTPPEAGSFFLGQAIADPGPAYYPIALLFRLTPLALLGLVALVGMVARLRRSEWRKHVGAISWLLLTALIFGAALTPAAKKADRYLLPIWPLLLVLAGTGLYLISRALTSYKTAIRLGLGALLLSQLFWLPPLTAYALDYYNPLLGGVAGARQAIMIGWGEGLESAADYLRQQPDAADLVSTTLYSEPLQANLAGRVLPLSRLTEADYLVDYVNMDQRELLAPEVKGYLARTEPTMQLVLGGARFVGVYPLLKPAFGEALRVDRVLLASDEAVSGARLGIDVHWTPQDAASTAWWPRLELLDDASRRVGQVDAAVSEGPPGVARQARVQLRLPSRRGTYTLALSTLDQKGSAAKPTTVPPWTRVDGRRLILSGVTIRAR